METLSKVLPAKTMSLCLRKMQEEAIRLADIQDLVSCPFCPFAAIVSDPGDKVFRCLNPECLKESCRFGVVQFGPGNLLIIIFGLLIKRRI